MKNPLDDLMQEATRLTRAGRLEEATAAIQRALAGTAAAPLHPTTTATETATATADSDWVIDGCVFEVPDVPDAADAEGHAREAAASSSDATGHAATAAPAAPDETTTPARVPADDEVIHFAADAGLGEFRAGTHTHGGRTLRFKLYLPPGHAGRALPLVVMLHGCTQGPDDFAAGTGMNDRAREEGFYVLYPEQAQGANPQRCWNWFKHNHQQRGRGEPALIADMTQALIRAHGIDRRRVYVAGLSAGGAMAAILAAAYPDLYAAVGVHSGLPQGAAGNVGEALAVMKSGAPTATSPGKAPARKVPTIVFHGDEDPTVHARNGERVIAALLRGGAVTAGGGEASIGAVPKVEQGASAQGRTYTRTVYPGERGEPIAEHWLVHGAGHAWSGGRAEGSYTDPKGPDATREMLRFFLANPLAALP